MFGSFDPTFIPLVLGQLTEYMGEIMGHTYFLAEVSKISCFFLSFIKLNRYIILHSHWWRLYIYRHILILYLHRQYRAHGTSVLLSPQWHLWGWSLSVPRGVGGISLSYRSAQARQDGQLAALLGAPLLWEIPGFSCCWDLLSRVRSTSSAMALLAWWGCIFHPPQRNNTSGEDITGFDNPWPVSSQFGRCLNSPVRRSRLENLIQVSVTSVAVSGFALYLRTPSTPAACRTMPAFSSCCHEHGSWMSQISYTWNSTVLVDSHFRPLPVLGGCQLTELQDIQSW